MPTYILLVERNPEQCRHYEKTLQKAGFVCHAVRYGVDAVAAFVTQQAKQAPHDLILMDCDMPNQEGLKTAKIIRRIEQEKNRMRARKPIPIIGFSSRVNFGTTDGWKAGMYEVIYKPVGKDDLLRVVERWR